MSKTGVKIQINSLEALERLIGDDDEFEVDLRASVIAAFAEKHLKGLVVTTEFQKAMSAVREYVDEKFANALGTIEKNEWGRLRMTKLHAEFENELGRMVRREFDNVVSEKLKEEAAFNARIIRKKAARILSEAANKATLAATQKLAEDLLGTMQGAVRDLVVSEIRNGVEVDVEQG